MKLVLKNTQLYNSKGYYSVWRDKEGNNLDPSEILIGDKYRIASLNNEVIAYSHFYMNGMASEIFRTAFEEDNGDLNIDDFKLAYIEEAAIINYYNDPTQNVPINRIELEIKGEKIIRGCDALAISGTVNDKLLGIFLFLTDKENDAFVIRKM